MNQSQTSHLTFRDQLGTFFTGFETKSFKIHLNFAYQHTLKYTEHENKLQRASKICDDDVIKTLFLIVVDFGSDSSIQS